MRKLIGYILAIVTAWLIAQWVHVHDATWGWYRLGAHATNNTDDALALCVFVLVGTVLCLVINEMANHK